MRIYTKIYTKKYAYICTIKKPNNNERMMNGSKN